MLVFVLKTKNDKMLRLKNILIVAIIAMLFLPFFSVCAGPPGFPNEAWTPQDVIDLMGHIRNFFLIVGVISMAIFIIWAGMSYLTAGGNEQKIKDAKKRFLWSLVGVAIILSTYAIISTIRVFLSKDWL
jgi:lysylphosphatidylglycerol synthetase-like protein (DUF2156 family)